MEAEKQVTRKLGVEMQNLYEAPKVSIVSWNSREDVLTTSGVEVKDFNKNWLSGFDSGVQS